MVTLVCRTWKNVAPDPPRFTRRGGLFEDRAADQVSFAAYRGHR